MNYLKFDACLSWPRSEDDRDRLLDAGRLEFDDEDREYFGDCGLDLDAYYLEAVYLPRKLGGDIDGDGAIDEIAQVVRNADGKRALALCRAGTWLDIVGVDDIEGGMAKDYIGKLEAWHWIEPGGELPNSIGTINLPQADGAVILLERIERELAALYWRDGELHAEQLYHIVEP